MVALWQASEKVKKSSEKAEAKEESKEEKEAKAEENKKAIELAKAENAKIREKRQKRIDDLRFCHFTQYSFIFNNIC